MNDEILATCNETELLQLARSQGLPPIKRGLPRQVLIDIVRGEIEAGPEHISGTEFTRKKLEEFIRQNWGQIRSQLPGCNGQCTRFPCSEGRHMLCFAPNKDVVV